MQIINIVITGGPCAGKSAAMPLIKETFTNKGYTVLFIPETATELIIGGVCPWTTGKNQDYQLCQCQLQTFKENIFEQAVRTMPQDKFLVVCDRGLLDNKAYMNQDEFNYVLGQMNTTEEEMLSRYDAVFHLVSAAKGLEDFYQKENNEARYETVEEASALDDRLIRCWEKHPNLKVIPNSYDFDQKMDLLLQKISDFLETIEK